MRQRTAVINELRAVYAKQNIDPQAKLGRVHPSVSGTDDLSGYGARIVGEDVELLGFGSTLSERTKHQEVYGAL